MANSMSRSKSTTTTTTIMRTFLFQLACLVSVAVCQPQQKLQAHFGGVTYASGMSYDSQHDVLYVTGQVGANGCFVGLLKSIDFQWISRHVLPEPAICQNLMNLYDHNTDQAGASTAAASATSKLLLLGTTQEGGLYTDTRVAGSDRATLYGLAMTLDIENVNAKAKASLSKDGHALMHLNQVQYPRSAVVDGAASNDDTMNFGNYIYVVSMDSENKSEQGTLGTTTDSSGSGVIPNLTPGGVTSFGSSYTMTVTKIKRHDDFSIVWEKEFGLHSSSSHGNRAPSVEVSQMIWNGVTLIIVGSTRGSGPAFGDSDNEEYSHGFITKIDPNNGRVWEAATDGNGDDTGIVTAKSQTRMSLKNNDNDSGDTRDTHIMGVCSASKDAKYIYVVGMSIASSSDNDGGGGMSTPFLAKMDALTLEQVWLQQLDEASTSAYGLACGVDGDYVYMAGIIEDGGTIASTTTSAGGDDVFVVQMTDNNNNDDDAPTVQWIRQVGSSGDDRLAHGGNGLLVNTNNGVFLYGDTSGDMYAPAEHPYELFVTHIGVDGTVPDDIGYGADANSGGTVPIVTPPRMDITDGGGDTDGNPSDGTDAPKPEVVPSDDSSDPAIKLEKGTGHRGIFFMTIILAGVFLTGYQMMQQKGDVGTERALVFSYLQGFDVEDMDVRHSATGGWHGTYVGKLAQGEGGNKPIAHSSIVKDSLFVDYDAAPSSSLATTNSASSDEANELEDDDFDDVDQYLDGSLSYADRKANLGGGRSNSSDPWGTDII